jgi:hypothetical protein
LLVAEILEVAAFLARHAGPPGTSLAIKPISATQASGHGFQAENFVIRPFRQFKKVIRICPITPSASDPVQNNPAKTLGLLEIEQQRLFILRKPKAHTSAIAFNPAFQQLLGLTRHPFPPAACNSLILLLPLPQNDSEMQSIGLLRAGRITTRKDECADPPNNLIAMACQMLIVINTIKADPVRLDRFGTKLLCRPPGMHGKQRSDKRHHDNWLVLKATGHTNRHTGHESD